MDDTLLFIDNGCSLTKVDRRYLPLVEAATAAYQAVFPGQIDAVRLLGSVARGEATIGQSDIDFMGLVRDPPTSVGLQVLDDCAVALTRAYPIVSRVDLDVGQVANLPELRRFVLSSDSVAIYGADTLTQRHQALPRERLIRLVTPDMAELIMDYRTAVRSLDERAAPEQLRFYSRVTGKDLLKCLRAAALRRGGSYEQNIQAIYHQVSAYLPECAPTAHGLYQLYHTPTVERCTLLRVLDEAERWVPLAQPT
jgi:predicted nucleotidyltransferase